MVGGVGGLLLAVVKCVGIGVTTRLGLGVCAQLLWRPAPCVPKCPQGSVGLAWKSLWREGKEGEWGEVGGLRVGAEEDWGKGRGGSGRLGMGLRPLILCCLQDH